MLNSQVFYLFQSIFIFNFDIFFSLAANKIKSWMIRSPYNNKALIRRFIDCFSFLKSFLSFFGRQYKLLRTAHSQENVLVVCFEFDYYYYSLGYVLMRNESLVLRCLSSHLCYLHAYQLVACLNGWLVGLTQSLKKTSAIQFIFIWSSVLLSLWLLLLHAAYRSPITMRSVYALFLFCRSFVFLSWFFSQLKIEK